MPSPIPPNLRELADGALEAQRQGVRFEIEPADLLLMYDAVDQRDPVRAANQLVALGQEVDDLRAELREMTAQMAPLVEERDELKAEAPVLWRRELVRKMRRDTNPPFAWMTVLAAVGCCYATGGMKRGWCQETGAWRYSFPWRGVNVPPRVIACSMEMRRAQREASCHD